MYPGVQPSSRILDVQKRKRKHKLKRKNWSKLPEYDRLAPNIRTNLEPILPTRYSFPNFPAPRAAKRKINTIENDDEPYILNITSTFKPDDDDDLKQQTGPPSKPPQPKPQQIIIPTQPPQPPVQPIPIVSTFEPSTTEPPQQSNFNQHKTRKKIQITQSSTNQIIPDIVQTPPSMRKKKDLKKILVPEAQQEIIKLPEPTLIGKPKVKTGLTDLTSTLTEVPASIPNIQPNPYKVGGQTSIEEENAIVEVVGVVEILINIASIVAKYTGILIFKGSTLIITRLWELQASFRNLGNILGTAAYTGISAIINNVPDLTIRIYKQLSEIDTALVAKMSTALLYMTLIWQGHMAITNTVGLFKALLPGIFGNNMVDQGSVITGAGPALLNIAYKTLFTNDSANVQDYFKVYTGGVVGGLSSGLYSKLFQVVSGYWQIPEFGPRIYVIPGYGPRVNIRPNIAAVPLEMKENIDYEFKIEPVELDPLENNDFDPLLNPQPEQPEDPYRQFQEYKLDVLDIDEDELERLQQLQNNIQQPLQQLPQQQPNVVEQIGIEALPQLGNVIAGAGINNIAQRVRRGRWLPFRLSMIELLGSVGIVISTVSGVILYDTYSPNSYTNLRKTKLAIIETLSPIVAKYSEYITLGMDIVEKLETEKEKLGISSREVGFNYNYLYEEIQYFTDRLVDFEKLVEYTKQLKYLHDVNTFIPQIDQWFMIISVQYDDIIRKINGITTNSAIRINAELEYLENSWIEKVKNIKQNIYEKLFSKIRYTPDPNAGDSVITDFIYRYLDEINFKNILLGILALVISQIASSGMAYLPITMFTPYVSKVVTKAIMPEIIKVHSAFMLRSGFKVTLISALTMRLTDIPLGLKGLPFRRKDEKGPKLVADVLQKVTNDVIENYNGPNLQSFDEVKAANNQYNLGQYAINRLKSQLQHGNSISDDVPDFDQYNKIEEQNRHLIEHVITQSINIPQTVIPEINIAFEEFKKTIIKEPEYVVEKIE